MKEKVFSVEELAQLCQVNEETVRRWRNIGVRGIFLKSTEETVVRGKPLLFTAEAVREFAAANPKVMTAALQEALSDVSAGRERPDLGGMMFSYYSQDSRDYVRRMLLSKKEALLRELEQTKKALEEMGES